MQCAQLPSSCLTWLSRGSGGPRPIAACKRHGTLARAYKAKDLAATADGDREAHKIFDEVVISVRAGSGGNGEVVESGSGRTVKNYKYKAGGHQPKKIWLPASEPAHGADGADIVLVCDPSLDSLLHLHKRQTWAGVRGANANPAAGSGGPKRTQGLRKAETPALELRVPPGTAVRRKGSGAVLGELLRPGQRLVVARGGKGGAGVVAPSRSEKASDLAREMRLAEAGGGEVVAVQDTNWRGDTKGMQGQALTLHLLLRVVADVGIVGFPNAGKSSLLRAMTRARPEVAPYPFTTLMPNLGVLGAADASDASQGPVLADLPGLIEGAHKGVGLGRMFLRHLRRTRLLLHVVDASAADPATDYLAVREELRMYNAEYCTRPHVVALNKMDLPDAADLATEVADEVMAAAQQLQDRYGGQQPGEEDGAWLPAAIVSTSAESGEGVKQLGRILAAVLRNEDLDEEDLLGDEEAGAYQEGVVAQGSSIAVGDEIASSSGGLWPGVAAEAVHMDSYGGQGGGGSSSGSSEDTAAEDDDEAAASPPPALDADDPDAWLFELSEEELLKLEAD